MFHSLHVSAFLLLSACALASENLGAREVEFVKRAIPDYRRTSVDGLRIKRAEALKLARRQPVPQPTKLSPVYHTYTARDPHWWWSHHGYGLPVGNSVLLNFGHLVGRIQSCNMGLMGGHVSIEIATQQLRQLVIQFELVILMFNGCIACYSSSGIGVFGGVFSQVFSSLNMLIVSFQKYYPNNWQLVFRSCFLGLDLHLSNFFGLCHSNGLVVNTFLPPGLVVVFGGIGLGSVATKLGECGFSVPPILPIFQPTGDIHFQPVGSTFRPVDGPFKPVDGAFEPVDGTFQPVHGGPGGYPISSPTPTFTANIPTIKSPDDITNQTSPIITPSADTIPLQSTPNNQPLDSHVASPVGNTNFAPTPAPGNGTILPNTVNTTPLPPPPGYPSDGPTIPLSNSTPPPLPLSNSTTSPFPMNSPSSLPGTSGPASTPLPSFSVSDPTSKLPKDGSGNQIPLCD